MDFDPDQQEILKQLLSKIKIAGLTPISTMADLWKTTDSKAKIIIDKILKLDPRSFGFRGEPVPIEEVPNDIVRIYNQQPAIGNKDPVDFETYLPMLVYQDFQKMNREFIKDYPGRKLIVGSGYRSNAYQISILIYYLVRKNNFDISKTLNRVAMPGYSQHSSVSHTAIDVASIDGRLTDGDSDDFKNSVEYKWLRQNANRFGFYESYPQDNLYGIIYEPWHWQYLGKLN
jgi:D-alanyl-D-alanine carboxypeptidase